MHPSYLSPSGRASDYNSSLRVAQPHSSLRPQAASPSYLYLSTIHSFSRHMNYRHQHHQKANLPMHGSDVGMPATVKPKNCGDNPADYSQQENPP